MTALLLLCAAFVAGPFRPGGAAADEDQAEKWKEFTGSLPFVFGITEGEKTARFTGRPAMFFLVTADDPYSKKLAATAFSDLKTVETIREHFTPVLVDGAKEKGLVRRFDLTEGYPWTIFTDHEGKAAVTVRGFVALEQFKKHLDRAVKKVGSPRPSEASRRLEKRAKELAEAMKENRVQDAIAAILEIEKEGVPCTWLDQALAAKERLLSRARDEIARARKLADEGNVPAARRRLNEIRETYEGLEVSETAGKVLKELEDQD